MVQINCLLLTLGLLFVTPAYSEITSAAKAASLYGSETTYSIYRKGKKVGSHSLIIESNNDQIEVAVESNITIRILKVPVFKFNYVSNEVWQNDQLMSVSATTTTNKDVETATLKNDDSASFLTYNDTKTQAPLIEYATNHWNINAVEQSILFNTIKGAQSKIKVEQAPNETLQIADKTLSVTQYKYTGDLTVQSWYDKNNRWVKLAFLGTDGSQITYVIDNP